MAKNVILVSPWPEVSSALSSSSEFSVNLKILEDTDLKTFESESNGFNNILVVQAPWRV